MLTPESQLGRGTLGHSTAVSGCAMLLILCSLSPNRPTSHPLSAILYVRTFRYRMVHGIRVYWVWCAAGDDDTGCVRVVHGWHTRGMRTVYGRHADGMRTVCGRYTLCVTIPIFSRGPFFFFFPSPPFSLFLYARSLFCSLEAAWFSL